MQLNTNHQRIYPGCTNKPIGSHAVAELVLFLLLANEERKVLTWEHSDIDVVVDTIRLHEWDHLHSTTKVRCRLS